ncbi:hypothetical protein BESB_016350 [Besnoitia besnoiti]|uniref:Uncharacterized protein n=1 Tax=Besnoitia besnoiti TaxID=94643 RepID=A0A2A9M9M9_BESBE|nr:hypothetical protein BESB_016350 [Besnoitia besnoiti]PFH32317.1 hypothetical protein BESB_016350 [Besnoitia besnoiti]
MASVAGFFFQSLNKSLVQVLLRQLGTRFLKYINADFDSAAVGGLMDHLCLQHVTLNLAQINSDLALHHIPLRLAAGSIAKVEINLYLAHAQLHVILTGFHVLLRPTLSSLATGHPGAAAPPSAAAAASAPSLSRQASPLSARGFGGAAAAGGEALEGAAPGGGVSKEIFDSQVEKIRAHIRVCTNQLFQEGVKKYLERLQRLIQQFALQLSERAPGTATEQALKAAIERHSVEYKKLQLYQQKIAQQEEERQPLLQWLLRYMPNVKIRIDDIHIHYDDGRGILSHPVRCGLKVARLLLQPQHGSWDFSWPQAEDDNHGKPQDGSVRRSSKAASDVASNVFLQSRDGERGDGSAGASPATGGTHPPSSAAGGAIGFQSPGTRDLTYGISLEGFGIYWEDACATAAATAAAAGTASSRTSSRSPGTSSPSTTTASSSGSLSSASSSSTLVRSPLELAEVLSSSLSASSRLSGGGLKQAAPSHPTISPTPARPVAAARRGGVPTPSSFTGEGRQGEAGASADDVVFFRRWFLRPVNLQAQLGLHNSAAAAPGASVGARGESAVVSGGAGGSGVSDKGLRGVGAPAVALGSSAVPAGSGAAGGSASGTASPGGAGGGAAVGASHFMLKFLGKIEEGGVEIEVDDGMAMGFAVFLERLRHHKRLRALRVYRPNMRPRCARGRQWRRGNGIDQELARPFCARDRGEGTTKQWWSYALQYVRLLRQQRPMRRILSAQDDAESRSNFWGQMQERVAHMKRYIRIAKRYMLEQRLQRLLAGPLMSASPAASCGASSPSAPEPSSPDSPSALPFALTSPPSTSPLSLSCPFLGSFVSALSLPASSSSGLPYTTADANLLDFFSHFWAERQAQLRRQEERRREHTAAVSARDPGFAPAGPTGPRGDDRGAPRGHACEASKASQACTRALYTSQFYEDDEEEDSDAAFIVNVISRRPYWAVAQWYMLAAAELAAAEKALLKQRQKTSALKDEQKDVRLLLAQLEQERQLLFRTRQRLLFASRLPAAGAVHDDRDLAQAQLQEKEQSKSVQRLQDKLQQYLQPQREAVLYYFETSSSFVRVAREAVAKLRELRKVEQDEAERDQEYLLKRSQAAEDYKEVVQELQTSASWRRSRERMLCWAEFYRNYTTVFPLTECVLVNVVQLQQLADQQQDVVLSLAESSRVPVKRAERRAPERPMTEEGQAAPARAVPPVPAFLQYVLDGRPFRVPALLRNVLLGFLVRRLSIRIAPRVPLGGGAASASRLALLQSRLEQERSRCVQWIQIEGVDAALRLQTFEELSLACCMRRCDVLHARGTRAPSTTAAAAASPSGLLAAAGGGGGGERGDAGGGRGRQRAVVVSVGQLRERLTHLLVRVAFADGAQAAEGAAAGARRTSSLSPSGTRRSKPAAPSSPPSSPPSPASLLVPGTPFGAGGGAAGDKSDPLDRLFLPAVQEGGAAGREDPRTRRAHLLASSPLGSDSEALGASQPSAVAFGSAARSALKRAFQRSVAATQRVEQRVSRRWIWVNLKLVTIPLLQTQFRLGVPLFLHCALQGQTIQVAGSTQQLQFLYEDVWRLWTVFLYTALGCNRELGVRQRSIQRQVETRELSEKAARGHHAMQTQPGADKLEFYTTLLSQYRAFNREVTRVSRQAKGGDDAKMTQTGPAAGKANAIDLHFLVERIVACVQGPSSLATAAAAPSPSPWFFTPISPEVSAVLSSGRADPSLADSFASEFDRATPDVSPRSSRHSASLQPSASSPALLEARRAAVTSFPPPSSSSVAGLPSSLSLSSTSSVASLGAAPASDGVEAAVASLPLAPEGQLWEEAAQRGGPAGGARSRAPAGLLRRREQEGVMRDWTQVAASLPLVYVLCRLKFPSVQLTLLSEPNFVPVTPGARRERRDRDRVGAAARPPGDGGERDARAGGAGGGGLASSAEEGGGFVRFSTFSSSLLDSDEERLEKTRRRTPPLDRANLEPCIVSITSVNGQQSLTPVPQRATRSARTRAAEEARSRRLRSAVYTCTFPSQTLLLTLGTASSHGAAAAARPRLSFCLSPCFSSATTAVLSFLSSFSILGALVREKLALYRLFRALLSSSLFDRAPGNLLNLVQQQVLVPASLSSTASLAALHLSKESLPTSRGESGGRDLPRDGPPPFAATAATAAAHKFPSVRSRRSEFSISDEDLLGLHSLSREKSAEDAQEAEEAWAGGEARLWLRLLESSLAPLPPHPASCEPSCEDLWREEDPEDVLGTEGSWDDPRRARPRGGWREDLDDDPQARENGARPTRLTCPVQQILVEDDGGGHSEAFLSHSEAEDDAECGEREKKSERDSASTSTDHPAGQESASGESSCLSPTSSLLRDSGEGDKADSQRNTHALHAAAAPDDARRAGPADRAAVGKAPESAKLTRATDAEALSGREGSPAQRKGGGEAAEPDEPTTAEVLSEKREHAAKPLSSAPSSPAPQSPLSADASGRREAQESLDDDRMHPPVPEEPTVVSPSVAPSAARLQRVAAGDEIRAGEVSSASRERRPSSAAVSDGARGKDFFRCEQPRGGRGQGEDGRRQGKAVGAGEEPCGSGESPGATAYASDASVSASTVRLGNILTRMGRRRAPALSGVSQPRTVFAHARSRETSPHAAEPHHAGAADRRADLAERREEETGAEEPKAASDDDVFRGLRRPKAGKKSHPFKLFNG